MFTSHAPVVTQDRKHGRTRTQARARALATAGGALAAVVVWIAEVPLAGISLGIRFGSGRAQTVGIGPVIGISLAASLLGWLVLAGLGRRSPRIRPGIRTVWTSAALAVLAVSLALPLAAATTTAAAAGLIAMHLAVAAVVIPLMARTAGSSQGTPRPQGSNQENAAPAGK